MGKKSKRRAGRRQQQQIMQQQQGQSLSSLPSLTTLTAPDAATTGMLAGLLEPRNMANFLIQEFVRLSSLRDPWMADRVTVFHIYIKLLSSELHNNLCTQEDWKFLKKIRRSDDTEAVIFRFGALELSGWMCLVTKKHRRDDCVKYFDKASAVCDSTSDLDKLRTLDLSGDLVNVGDYMTRRRESWCSYISNVAETTTGAGWGPNGNAIAVPMIPGSLCDCCKKSRCQLGVVNLQKCSACQMAYYCSAECQRKAWKQEGHKKVCRKKGEFKPGDLAYTLEASGNISSDTKVRVVAPAPCPGDRNQENPNLSWIVKDDDENVTIVSAGRLKRVRPALWNAWGRAEVENVVRELERRQDVGAVSESSDEEESPPNLANGDLLSDDES